MLKHGGAANTSTQLQSYLYANNKSLAQAQGTQQVSMKSLALIGGQATQDLDGTTTGWVLSVQAGDIVPASGPIDRQATAQRTAALHYSGFQTLSSAAQAKVVAYVQAQLPPDAQLVAGAQVSLHGFIVLADASLSGLTQITDYSLRQIGADGLPAGSLQSHVVRSGDTLQTIAQVYFGSSAYWYLIADANGLQGTERLQEGTTLAIPNKVANSANTAETFKVYNESEIIGSTSPEIRTVAKKKEKPQGSGETTGLTSRIQTPCAPSRRARLTAAQ